MRLPLHRRVPRNTFVIFLSDNGYKTGHHRLNSKNSLYLEDERFPLLVRWPREPIGRADPRSVSAGPPRLFQVAPPVPQVFGGVLIVRVREGGPSGQMRYGLLAVGR